MIYEIIVPQLGVNDEVVKVVKWHLNDKDKVRNGSLLCVVETSKAVMDLYAENVGFVRIVKQAGEEAKIKEIIGYIVDSLEDKIPDREPDLSKEDVVRITNKAKDLALSLGIDIRVIKKTGIIREKDVRDFYKSKSG